MTAHRDDSKPRGLFLRVTPDLEIVSEPLNVTIHKVTKKGEGEIGWLMIHHSTKGTGWMPIPEKMAQAWTKNGAVEGNPIDITDLAEMMRDNPTRH